MLTERQLDLARTACRTLKDCGNYLLPEDNLRGHMRRSVAPPASTGETDEVIRHLDEHRRIHATDTETGRKWTLTDEGRSWLARNP